MKKLTSDSKRRFTYKTTNMKIEITIKSARLKEFSEEEKEERRTQRLIGNSYESGEDDIMGKIKDLPIEFSYRPYVIDTYDIIGFTPFDETHTVLFTDGHGDLIVKMNFETWKSTFQYITGNTIKTIQEFSPEKIISISEEDTSKKGKKNIKADTDK